MGLRRAWAHVILEIISKTESPNVSGWKRVQRRGSKKLHDQRNHRKNPQDSYATVLCVIQQEWIFLQNVTTNTGESFVGIEKIFWDNFCLVFSPKKKHLSPIVGSLSTAPVKKSGLSLLNPVTSANKKYPSFQWASTELIWAVTGEVIFPTPITFWRSGKKSTMNRKSGWCQWHQTQGFNQGLQYHQQEPYPTRQQEKVPGWIYEVLW